MNEILSMREKRAKLWDATKAFVESRKDANGTLSAEDTAGVYLNLNPLFFIAKHICFT